MRWLKYIIRWLTPENIEKLKRIILEIYDLVKMIMDFLEIDPEKDEKGGKGK